MIIEYQILADIYRIIHATNMHGILLNSSKFELAETTFKKINR